MPYPVSVSVEPALANRNRLTTAFRLILAMLVGSGVGIAVTFGGGTPAKAGGEGGLLGGVAFLLAIVSWFTGFLGVPGVPGGVQGVREGSSLLEPF